MNDFYGGTPSHKKVTQEKYPQEKYLVELKNPATGNWILWWTRDDMNSAQILAAKCSVILGRSSVRLTRVYTKEIRDEDICF